MILSSIVPVATWPNPSVFLRLSDFYAVPNTTLNAQYEMLDSGSNVMAVARVNLTSGQYAGWGAGNDDAYLAACYAENLNLTLVTGSGSA